jgi:hypothetical protein
MRLQTTQTEKGIKIEVIGDAKAAVVIREGEKERILLPIRNKYADTTYYYEDSSGLAETNKGYIGFYPGNPDAVELIE